MRIPMVLRAAPSKSAPDLDGADSGSEAELLQPPCEVRRVGIVRARRNPWTRPAAFLGGGTLGLLMLMSAVTAINGRQVSTRKQADAKLDSSLLFSEYHPSDEHKNNIHDGNVCRDDEEMFSGLCYKKCQLLTDGAYPIRTTAMTCCSERPCGFFNQKHDAGFCSGFSVAGGDRGACPHPPGACLDDEELHMGFCLMKCSILTHKKFPYRVGPATCCQKDNEGECLVPGNDLSKTSVNFNAGGGKGRVGFMHSPVKALTEAVGPNGETWTSSSTHTSTTVTTTTTTKTSVTSTTITTVTTTMPRSTSEGETIIPHWAGNVVANPASKEVQKELAAILEREATTDTTTPSWLNDIVESTSTKMTTTELLPQPAKTEAQLRGQVMIRALSKPIANGELSSPVRPETTKKPFYQPSADFFDPADVAAEVERESKAVKTTA